VYNNAQIYLAVAFSCSSLQPVKQNKQKYNNYILSRVIISNAH